MKYVLPEPKNILARRLGVCLIIAILIIIGMGFFGYRLFNASSDLDDTLKRLRLENQALYEQLEYVTIELWEMSIQVDILEDNQRVISGLVQASDDEVAAMFRVLDGMSFENLRSSINRLGSFALSQININKQILRLTGDPNESN